jgi:uncharacterized radical SAM superfamily protein
VMDIVVEARLRFPDKPLYLGCMRPRGRYRLELDPLAVRAGVNVIVNPAREAVRLAEELGLRITRGRECCVVRGFGNGAHPILLTGQDASDIMRTGGETR